MLALLEEKSEIWKKQCVEWKERHNSLEQVLDIHGKEPVADSDVQRKEIPKGNQCNTITIKY